MLGADLKAALASRKAAVDARGGATEAVGAGSRAPGALGGVGGVRLRPREGGGTLAPAGLANQGATCYLNSLLQALYGQGDVRAAVLGFAFDPASHGEAKRCVTRQLQELFAELALSEAPTAATTRLTRSFGWEGAEAFVQNDVHECLTVLLEAVGRECSSGSGAAAAAVGDLLHGAFTGSLAHVIRCDTCGGERARAEPFTTLMLPVRGSGDVDGALRAALAEEALSGANAVECAACASRQPAHKGARLTRAGLPPVLVLHLDRFEFDYATMGRRKVADAIAIPPALDMRPHVHDGGGGGGGDNDGDLVYELCAVLMHSGSTHSGHYYAHVRTSAAVAAAVAPAAPAATPTTRWVCFNDSVVSNIPADLLPRALGARGASAAPTPPAPTPTPAGAGCAPAHDASTGAYLLLYRRASTLAECFPPLPSGPAAAAALVPADVRERIDADNAQLREAAARWEAERRKLRFRVVPAPDVTVVAAAPASAPAAPMASPRLPAPPSAAAGPRPPAPRPALNGPPASAGGPRPPAPPAGPPATHPRPPGPKPPGGGGSSGGAASPEAVIDRDGTTDALLAAAVQAVTGAPVAAAELPLWRLRVYDASAQQPLQPVVTGGEPAAPVASLPSLFLSPPPSALAVGDTTADGAAPLLRTRTLYLESRQSPAKPWEEWEGPPLAVAVVLVTPRVATEEQTQQQRQRPGKPLDAFAFSPPVRLQLKPSQATVGGLRAAAAAAAGVDSARLRLVVLHTAHEAQPQLLDDYALPLLVAGGSADGTTGAQQSSPLLPPETVVHVEVCDVAAAERPSALLPAWDARLHAVTLTCVPCSALAEAATASSSSPSPSPPLQLCLDGRDTVAALRAAVAAATGWAPDAFKLCRSRAAQPPAAAAVGGTTGWAPAGELKDAAAPLVACGLVDGCNVYVFPGPPMPLGHVSLRLTLAAARREGASLPTTVADDGSGATDAPTSSAPYALLPLGSLELPADVPVAELKRRVFDRFRQLLPAYAATQQHLRLRAPLSSATPATAVRLGRLLPDDRSLESAVAGAGAGKGAAAAAAAAAKQLGDGTEVVVQPLTAPETACGSDGLVSVYRWAPMTGGLHGPTEVLLATQAAAAPGGAASLAAFWEQAASALGVPQAGDVLLAAKPWAWQLGDTSNLWRLPWVPLSAVTPAAGSGAPTPLHTGGAVGVGVGGGLSSPAASLMTARTSFGDGADASTVTAPPRVAVVVPDASTATASSSGFTGSVSAGTTPAPSPMTVATAGLAGAISVGAGLGVGGGGGDGMGARSDSFTTQLSAAAVADDGDGDGAGPSAQHPPLGTPSSSAAAAAAAAAKVITTRLRSVAAAAAAATAPSSSSAPAATAPVGAAAQLTVAPGDSIVLVAAEEYRRLDAPGRPASLGGAASASYRSGGNGIASSRHEEAFKIYTPAEQVAREAARAAAAERAAAEVAERSAALQALLGGGKAATNPVAAAAAAAAAGRAGGADDAASPAASPGDKYAKLLALGVPWEQVQARMALDGVPPAVLPPR